MIMGWSEQIVAILPTGAGKSMLFLVPCSLPGAATAILVVPLVALRGDLLRRTARVGIDDLEWLPGERREAHLVIVSVEAAGTKDFMTYAQQLVARQRLDRIVVDECHLGFVLLPHHLYHSGLHLSFAVKNRSPVHIVHFQWKPFGAFSLPRASLFRPPVSPMPSRSHRGS